MSRRFGRNQKRAMRRQIELLECAKTVVNNERLKAERVAEALHRDMDMVKAALGPNFIGFSVVDAAIHIDELYPDDTFRFVARGDEVVRMHAVRVRDIGVTDNPKHLLHVRVTLAGSEVAYAMSESALFSLNVSERFLADGIANEIAPHLLKIIRQKRGRH